MAWRMVDYFCRECDAEFESLEDSRDIPEVKECEYCGDPATKCFPSPGLITVDYGCVRGRTEKHPPWALCTDPEIPEAQRKEHNRKRRDMYRKKEFGIT